MQPNTAIQKHTRWEIQKLNPDCTCTVRIRIQILHRSIVELLINIYIRLVLQLSWLLTLQLVNDHLLKGRKSTPHDGIDNLQAPVHRQHVLQLQSFCLQAIKCHRTRHPPTPISKLCKEIKIWVHAALAKRYFCIEYEVVIYLCCRNIHPRRTS